MFFISTRCPSHVTWSVEMLPVHAALVKNEHRAVHPQLWLPLPLFAQGEGGCPSCASNAKQPQVDEPNIRWVAGKEGSARAVRAVPPALLYFWVFCCTYLKPLQSFGAYLGMLHKRHWWAAGSKICEHPPPLLSADCLSYCCGGCVLPCVRRRTKISLCNGTLREVCARCVLFCGVFFFPAQRSAFASKVFHSFGDSGMGMHSPLPMFFCRLGDHSACPVVRTAVAGVH